MKTQQSFRYCFNYYAIIWLRIFTGSASDLAGKEVMATENANDRLEKRIDVYPLTPSLIEKLRPSALKSQANPKLDEQVKTGNTVSALGIF